MKVQAEAVPGAPSAPSIARPVNLARYADLHKWMIIPMIVMQAGIFMDYWGDFRENAWAVHVHYVIATLWYLYLIIQPYFATHGALQRHRTNGIIGMFLAGGVALTALSMLHRDMATAERTLQFPERFGPLGPWFFYGVAVVEIVLMAAFVYAVLQSIVHRKETEQHAWWLVSTVFIIMMPALGRGLQLAWFRIAGFGPETDAMAPIYVSVLVIIALTFWGARRYGRINHPATYVAVGANLFVFLMEPLGRSEALQAILRTVVRG
jgi:hypothetical protein